MLVRRTEWHTRIITRGLGGSNLVVPGWASGVAFGSLALEEGGMGPASPRWGEPSCYPWLTTLTLQEPQGDELVKYKG